MVLKVFGWTCTRLLGLCACIKGVVLAGDVHEGVIRFVGNVEAERLEITKNDKFTQVSKKHEDSGKKNDRGVLAGGSSREHSRQHLLEVTLGVSHMQVSHDIDR